MQAIRSTLFLVAAVIALAACSQGAKVDKVAEEAAVRAVNTAWVKAYAAGDAAGVAALYADDAVLSPSGAPAVRGSAAILEQLNKDIAAMKASGLSAANDPGSDVGISADLAWETGQITVTDPSGSPVETGKFTTIFAKRDGNWKIVRDTYNSNSTPPAGGSGTALRIVNFTAASAESQQAAIKLVDEEINPLYAAAKGFQWVKYYTDAKTLETGSVSLWSTAADIEAFLQSDGYKQIPGKLKPLMKGSMNSRIVAVHAPPK
jgi:uncharacterized protein (TIGR02246 family)